MHKGLRFPLLALVLSGWTSPASADFTLVLKNGRRITVQSYREEGQMIKFNGLGGEIGISKDQIRSIQKAGGAGPVGLTLSTPGLAATSPEPQAEPQPAERSLSPEEERAKEEKEYQQRLSEIDAQLKDVWDRYSLATRGTTSRDPTLLTNEEEIKRLNEDAASRLKDAENRPTDPGIVNLTTQSPFSTLGLTTEVLRPPTPAGPSFGSLPPSYTERERELSDLRNRLLQLGKERRQLLEEMRQKNFWTGSLSLE
jgi:DNA repair exonuclease SbcCD ATPase subunit